MLDHTQPERTLRDDRFGLQLADQRASDSSVPVLRQNQQIRQTNFATALNDDHPTDRLLIQNHEPSIQSCRNHRVVTLKASVYERDQLVALRVVQICVLERFQLGQIEQTRKERLVVSSDRAQCQDLTQRRLPVLVQQIRNELLHCANYSQLLDGKIPWSAMM
jgi:hypothetical protein